MIISIMEQLPVTPVGHFFVEELKLGKNEKSFVLQYNVTVVEFHSVAGEMNILTIFFILLNLI